MFINKELVNNNFVIYKTEGGTVNVNVILEDETIWITQKGMAELFSIDKSSISRHLKNIFN